MTQSKESLLCKHEDLISSPRIHEEERKKKEEEEEEEPSVMVHACKGRAGEETDRAHF